MKSTVIYIRVSTSQQTENGQSLENQLNRLREYCKYHGFQNIIEISDEGISGKSTNRPGFQKMIELARKHQIENVIVHSLSRFVRNTVDAIKTMNLFNKYDVSFHSITESLDTSIAIGRFFISTLASLSQLEKEQIGERTKSVQQMKKEKGERIGHVSFGYKLVEDGKAGLNSIVVTEWKLTNLVSVIGFIIPWTTILNKPFDYYSKGYIKY